MNTFTRSVDLLQRAMDANTLRYQVSANNIANAEVPNYKRQEVNFESELKGLWTVKKTLPIRSSLQELMKGISL